MPGNSKNTGTRLDIERLDIEPPDSAHDTDTDTNNDAETDVDPVSSNPLDAEAVEWGGVNWP